MSTLKERIDQTVANVADFPKPGIQYKDITPLFLDANLSNDIVEEFAEKAKGKIDAVCGIESRGFLYGIQIAQKLGVPFILVRKAGKLPPPTVAQSYDLEYGQATIEINPTYIKEDMRILVHDDVLATGGTAEACAKLIEKLLEKQLKKQDGTMPEDLPTPEKSLKQIEKENNKSLRKIN